MSEYTLTESAELEKKLIRNLTAQYSKLRSGIHMSDLVLCARQSLARKLYPIAPDVVHLGYFFDGSRRHESLQALYGDGVAEKGGTFEGVDYHIDLLDKETVIEFKTTRGGKAISEHWLRQLVFYMVAENLANGVIQVQRINQKETPFQAYHVSLDENQRRHVLTDFRERRDLFKSALEKKDLALVPIFRGDGDWLCRGCEYRKEYCDPIEAKTK